MKKYILLIFACIYAIHLNAQNARSEERRVGKEC